MRPGFAHGLRHVLRGFSLIVQPGIRRYVAIPLSINVAVFVGALWSIGAALDRLLARYLGAWPEWLHALVWLVCAIVAALFVFLTFSVVANLIASPFNGLLAEAVEASLAGQTAMPALDARRLLRELGRSAYAEARKLFYIALRALPLLVLSVIPVLNVAAPPLWLLFGAWMLAMEYLDCPLGNHGRLFPAVITDLRQHRAMALGFGAGVTLLTLVPGLNFLAMPVGVAGATSMYCAHYAPGRAPKNA